jgi:hypothetical protein
MLVRLILVVFSACPVGLLVYAACVIWPLNMFKSTGLIAGISAALCWILVLAVYLDSRSESSGGVPKD